MFKLTTPTEGTITKIIIDHDPKDFELAGKGITIKPTTVQLVSPIKGKIITSTNKKIVISSKSGLIVALSGDFTNLPEVNTKIKEGSNITTLSKISSFDLIVTSGHSFNFTKKDLSDKEIINM